MEMSFLARVFGGRKQKILVVEDHPEILSLVKDVLMASGYQVTTAADGIQGLAKYNEDTFDLLILDHNMPRMGGSELLMLIRSQPEGKNQAVIMLSGEQMLEPINQAYDKGIVAWIPKPFSPVILLEKVAAQLKPRNLKA